MPVKTGIQAFSKLLDSGSR